VATYGDAPELLERVSPAAGAALTALAQAAPEGYLVGGVVRDLLLSRPSRDLDVVTVAETPVQGLATDLQRRLGGKLVCHGAFLTCSLDLPGLTLDLARARAEHYPHPGALPQVRPSSLAHDLHRRDFSVNTFALHLREPHTLLSVPRAKADLEAGTLRVLHDGSFVDDPTRIVRGARLAGRLGFRYDAPTARALAAALAAAAHRLVSPERLRAELLLTLAERAVAPALAELAASGALSALYGLRPSPLVADLDALRANPEADSKTALTVPAESYLLALLLALSEAEAEAHARHLGWPKRLLAARAALLTGTAPPRTDAEQAVYRVLYPRAAGHPQLRGSDVLSLGLPAGPEVGRVLSLVARARRDGQVASFAAELELAKRLVHETLTRENA